MKKLLLSFFIFCCIGIASFAQVPVVDFTGNPTTVCAGQSVTWTNLTTGATTYTWSFPGASGNTTSTTQNPNPKTYNTPGTFTVTLIAANANGSDTLIRVDYITVLASPTIAVTPSSGSICTLGSITLTASGGTSYSWAPSAGLDNTTGATVIATPSASITYSVTGNSANGCTRTEDVTVSVLSNPPATPGGITGPTTVCSGQTAVYTVPSTGNPVPIRTWTVPAGATVTAGQGTRSVTITFGSTSGTVCVTSSNACGSSAASCQAIVVNPTPQVGAVGSITGPAELCGAQTGVTYSIGAVANASTYTWTTTGTASVTAGQGTTTVTVDFGAGNGGVCVSAGNDCNTSSQVCKTVTVTPGIPAAPGGITGLTTVCNGQVGVKYSVASVATTTYYLWTVPSGASITAGQGTPSITITYGASSGTICVSDSNACGKSAASCQEVIVDPASVVGTVGTITGPTTICGNQSATYSIASVAGASTYSWSIPAGAVITTGQGTETVSITYSVTGGNICVTAANSCSTSPPKCLNVALTNTPAIPGPISGPTVVCTGQTGVVFTVPSVGNPAPTRTWTVPPGATITAGQGTRSVTVTFAGASSGTICCTASNVCGSSASACQAVTVDPGSAVGTVGTITGPITICGNQSATYSIASVAGAATYSWSVPAGAVITTGQGTETVSITYSVTGGNVCVTAANSCSTSPPKCLSVSLTNIPAVPGAITGPTTVCNGQTNVVYTVPGVVAPAPTRTWTVPPGATITAGQGTRSVTVTFAGASSGTICCTASNSCGTSAASCEVITVDPNPVVGAVSTITGPTAVCTAQSGVSYSIPAVAGASTYTWTVPAGAAITAGQGTTSITVTYSVTAGNICVTAGNSCSTSPPKCLPVAMSTSIAATPGAITGATTVCSGQVGPYSITPVAGATSYAWTVPAGSVSTSSTATTVVTFGTASGTVCVASVNGCGTSAQSCSPVLVTSAVLTVSATITNTSNSTLCDGSSTAIPSGGAGPYTYAWSPSGATTALATGLCYGNQTVCVTNAGGCVTCKTVFISSPNGLPELTDNGTIHVFPNPANDHIYIEGTLSVSAQLQISVVNMFGQRLTEESVFAGKTFSQKINIRGIPPGVYFVEIRSGEMVRNSRIIIIN